MHELLTMVSGWLVSYLTHSAVTLAILGAMAWLGDRLLRKVDRWRSTGCGSRHCWRV